MGHILLLIRDFRVSEETFSQVIHIHSSLIYYVRSRGQSSVLEDSREIYHTNVPLLLCPVLCCRWPTSPPSSYGAATEDTADQGWVYGQRPSWGRVTEGAHCQSRRCDDRSHILEPFVLLAQRKYSGFFFFFFLSAIHIIQPRSIHNKLLAWGIFHERFYICLVHGSSKLLCLSQSGKLTEQ